MSIEVKLFNDERTVFVDERTAELGGSFYLSPHLQPYSPLPLRWCFDQLIRYPKATLIDVGASTGAFTLLSKHHPDLKVWSFEPVDLTYRVLKENVYLNGLDQKVSCHKAGVSNYNGNGVLHSIKEIGGSGVSMVDGVPAPHKHVKDTPITVITLDRFCDVLDIVPTFIKIDTEGGEKFVLEGAAKTIEKYHPFLLFEYQQTNADQYGYGVHELVKMVEDWGYLWTNPEGLDLWCVYKEWESLSWT